jgi:hypothetical protein
VDRRRHLPDTARDPGHTRGHEAIHYLVKVAALPEATLLGRWRSVAVTFAQPSAPPRLRKAPASRYEARYAQ